MPFNKIKINSLENNSITTAKIQNDAVTTGKVGPSAATAIKLNTDVITGLSELNETAADTDFILIYDTSTSSLKKLLKSNLDNTSPTISSITPTNIFSNDSSLTTFTITGTNFTAGSNARLIGNDGTVLSFDTVIRNSTTQITATFNNSSLVLNESGDPYSVQVINGTGQATVLADQVNLDQSPVFLTAAGSLGTQRIGTFSATVEATDPDSTGPVTYEIVSGSLPTGITLNSSTGIITGSITPETSETTYNFTIRANDSTSNTSNRAFSITLQGPQITSFTSSGTFSVPVGITTVDVLVVAGGGGGGGGQPDDGGGGGGAGGLIFRPGFTVTPGGTVSVTVGNGGSAGAYDPGPSPKNGGIGQDSTFGTLVAKGGGGGKSQGISSPGSVGGSGGGGAGEGCSGPGAGATATQPTQPGDSGAYGFGNPGGRNSPLGSGVRGNGGGGGGAGGTGNNGQASNPGQGGVGGIGKTYTIADGTTPVYYAGGGGGGSSSQSDIAGGQGGGGTSGHPEGYNVGTNLGGGGGAGHKLGGGGTGGKGIVIVKY